MSRRALRPLLVLAPLPLVFAGCHTATPRPAAEPEPVVAAPIEPSPEIQRRADADRVRALEIEVERLREDLRTAEETLLAVESGMRGNQGRAAAVSALAEARIQVERAAKSAPWRVNEATEARAKLVEAERQLAEQHVDSAIFFVSRARRIAESLTAEAARVRSHRDTAFVRGDRVNLRKGPSQETPVLSTLPARLPVFVEGHAGDWSLVRTTTGHVGFVRADLLTLN